MRAFLSPLRAVAALGLAAALSLLAPGVAGAQSVPLGYLSAATNNSTLVIAGNPKSGGGVLLKALVVVNTTGTLYYLKLYDKATAPVCGTDTPKWRVPLPGSASNPAPVALPSEGLMFPLGLGFCIVANLVDSDNTAAVTGIAVNLGVSRR
jgi:hypothetical protein